MKTYLLAVLLFCSLTASAQRKGLAIYLKTGGGYANDNAYDGPSGYVRGISEFHLSALAGAGYMFNDHFGLFAGVGVATYLWEHGNYYSPSYNPSYKQEQVFLEIPVFARIVTSKYGKTGFFADAGYKICLLKIASNNRSGEYALPKPANASTVPIDNQADFRQTTLALYTHCGFNCALGGRGSLLFGPDVHYQLSNNFNYGNSTGHLLAIGFKLGLNVQVTPWHKIHLKKRKKSWVD